MRLRLISPEYIPPSAGGFFLCVHYMFHMTSSIPDSISSEALEAFKADAKAETTPTPMKDADRKVQIDRVIEAVEELSDEWGTVFSYKLIADYALHQLFVHHREVASQYFEEGNQERSSAWSRDAGHFQVISNTLRNVVCGPDDFLFSNEE